MCIHYVLHNPMSQLCTQYYCFFTTCVIKLTKCYCSFSYYFHGFASLFLLYKDLVLKQCFFFLFLTNMTI